MIDITAVLSILSKKSDKKHFFSVAVSDCGKLINGALNSFLFPKC